MMGRHSRALETATAIALDLTSRQRKHLLWLLPGMLAKQLDEFGPNAAQMARLVNPPYFGKPLAEPGMRLGSFRLTKFGCAVREELLKLEQKP